MGWEERTAWISECLPQLGMRLQQDMGEIRLRAGQPALITKGRRSIRLKWTPRQHEVEQAAEALCGHSLYARREEAAQGSITLRGGHRLGLCGRMGPRGLAEVSSFCLRLAGEWPGAADELVRSLNGQLSSVLVIGPPGAGKTTLLRDLCRQYSQQGIQTALHDQRGEMAAMVGGMPQLDVGPCTDVLEGCVKREGIWQLMRTMSPEVVIMDEISVDELKLVERYSHLGIKLCASVHGSCWEDAAHRLGLFPWVPGGLAFDRYAVLAGGRITQLLDGPQNQ